MNLILFTPEETAAPLPLADPRARHLTQVLRRRDGDGFDAGLVNGPRGRGTLVASTPAGLMLAFVWGEPPPPPEPLSLLIGLPRPQTARDILRESATLGVAALHFVATDKSDPGYAQSTLWRDGEWRRHVLAGAMQACDTRVPHVTHGSRLGDALARLPAGGMRLALDNYEATEALTLAAGRDPHQPLVLAFGPERGWAEADRAALREHGFTLVHLGSRVLRLETAVVAAVTLVKAARGSL